jgi:hypothetical protein
MPVMNSFKRVKFVFTYFIVYFYLFIYLAGVEPSPLLLRPLIGLLYQPCRTIDDDNCGEIGRINGWLETPAPVPLCPQRIQQDLTCAGTQAAAAESQRLNAQVMVRSESLPN